MPTKIELSEVSVQIGRLKKNEFVDCFLGAMMTTQGILILLFSNRKNKEFPLIISGTETAKVIEQVKAQLS
jgi:hypothetical protein